MSLDNKQYYKQNWHRIKRNVEKNMKRGYYDWNEIKGLLVGRVSVLVASGPSLESNLPILQDFMDEHGDSVALFCDNRSYRTLKTNGITPDYVVALDRLSEPIGAGEEVLLCSYETNYKLVGMWKGRKYIAVLGDERYGAIVVSETLKMVSEYEKKRAGHLCNNQLMKDGKVREAKRDSVYIPRFRTGGNVGTGMYIFSKDLFGARFHIFIGHDYGSRTPFDGSVELEKGLFSRPDYMRYCSFQENEYILNPHEFGINCSLEGIFNYNQQVKNLVNLDFVEVKRLFDEKKLLTFMKERVECITAK